MRPSGPVALEVIRNGRRVCTAGLAGKPGVITSILTCVSRDDSRELTLDVGGLDSAAQQHLTWATLAVRIGDEIAIKIVESSKISRVRSRTGVDLGAKHEKAWLRKTARRLGYKLVKAERREPFTPATARRVRR